MTTREFLVSVQELACLCAETDDTPTYGLVKVHASELVETAEQLIKKLDAKNEQRKSSEKAQQKKAEVADRCASVRAYLMENAGKDYTRDEIAAALNITAGQVSAAIRNIEGIVKGSRKVDKSKLTTYMVAA